jgi:16S rRNA (guanine527-N7)-methyltransferase
VFHVKQADPVALTPEATERLNAFADLLRQWNRRINLVAPADVGDLWRRHVLDSAQLADLVPPDAPSFVDLGSGAGFPGLVLAIVTGRHVHLVESDQRKAAFLREAARVTRTSATVHAARAESLRVAPQPLVTARALAPLATLLTWAAPILAPGGICLFPKGRGVEPELTAAAAEWHMRVERVPSHLDAAATILRISEVHRAPVRS